MPAPRRTLIGLAAAALVLTTTACGDLDQAASAQGIARNDLASELATQLGGSATRTFTAGYRMRGHGEATVTQAQNPPRTAYEYPGGQLLSTAAEVTTCAGQKCDTTAAPRSGALPADTLAPALKAGLVAPATVVSLLNETALDTAAEIEPRDTTIAGLHATCIEVRNLSDPRISTFTTCVTNDGVLGTFQGTLDDQPIDLAMTSYTDKADDAAFATP